MDNRDDWREWEGCACDESYASQNEWNIAPLARTDDTASDARPGGQQGRIMVIGFHVIRL